MAASLHAFAASANPAPAPQHPQEPPVGPDPLEDVRTTPHTAEWPPWLPRRAVPAGRIIAALSATAVVLLTVGAIMLHSFGSGTQAPQQAQDAGSGWAASQSASAAPSASAAAASAHQGKRSASPRPSESKSANGKQDNSPSPGDTRSTSSSRSSGSNGSGATASPSSAPTIDAGGVPILQASANQVAHKCTVIGSAYDSNTGGTVQGVVCADILTSSASGHYVAQGQLEVYCQTSAGTVQCADAIADGELANAAGGVVGSTGAYQCGHSYGPCSAGRNYVKTGSYSYSGISESDCSSNVSLATDAWALAVGNGSTKIELPGSDDWVSLSSSNADDGANQSTGHHYICP